ncbi:MAG: GNAT family N-acetyltransferase [Candidatus Thorarchaeota archaeon]|jgi:predicted acetyltransferase
MFEIREAQEEDREPVIELLTKEFKAIGVFEDDWVHSWRNYWNRPENDDWAYVATKNDTVVSTLAYFVKRNQNTIRGNPICFSGVWAVTTDSAYRRQGLLKGIYDKAFSDMNERGVVLSILEPSPYLGAQIAYERMGYVVAEKRVKHSFSPDALKPIEGVKDISARELNDPDETAKILKLESSMNRYGSRVYSIPFFFIHQIKSGNFYIFERDSKPVGCIRFLLNESNGTLQLDKVFFVSETVLSSIIELINQKTNDAAIVEWICDPQIPLRNFCKNVKNLESKNDGSMMMRVVNFEEYCKSIRFPHDHEASLTLKLSDVQCPWNDGVYTLSLTDGEFCLEQSTSEKDVDVSLNPHELSSVVCGHDLPSTLRDYQQISCSSQTAQILDTMFPLDSFQSYFRF